MSFLEFLAKQPTTYREWIHRIGVDYYEDPGGGVFEHAIRSKLARPKRRCISAHDSNLGVLTE